MSRSKWVVGIHTRLADKIALHTMAATNFIRTVVGGLAQGLERPTEFENIPIAILPVIEEGEVAADGVNACQR